MLTLSSARVRSGVRGRRRIRRDGSPVIQPWVRHQAAAERSASSRALTVALLAVPQWLANQRPTRSAAGSWSSTAIGVSGPSSVTKARSVTR